MCVCARAYKVPANFNYVKCIHTHVYVVYSVYLNLKYVCEFSEYTIMITIIIIIILLRVFARLLREICDVTV